MRTFQAGPLPAWHFDPATAGQLKVLRFFGVPHPPALSKGHAGSLIGRLFSDPTNKHLWAAYVYTTGDEDHSTSELRPHDMASLATVVLPEDWRPRASVSISKERRKAMDTLVADLLTDGSPFDDPLPEISIAGTVFVFTGRFEFGSRFECQQAVISRGGSYTDNVTGGTDVLVIGSDASPSWAHGAYGNKIAAAMVRRLEQGRPMIIPEEYWKQVLAT